MSRAVIIENSGGPEVLKIKEIELGEIGPGEVLLENKAIGLNFIDTYHRSGLYPLKLPSGIGLEAAGIIKKIGKKVKGFSVGDSVAYASAPLGAYADERIFPSNKLVKVPPGVSLEVAASIMTKGLTTFYLLHKTFVPRPNDTILFHAAAGGVGQIFCQWAKSLGCKVIGTVGSDEKMIIAKKNGCDLVINYTKEDFAKKVLDYTNGKGVPVVYDGVGAKTYERSIECLKPRGMLVSFGNASGPVKNIDVMKSISPKSLFFSRPTMGHYLSTKEELTEAAEMLFKKIEFGKVKIEIFKKYNLKDVVQSHKDLESRKIIGPAIIIP
jgi:NADPH:quinone reductase